MTRASYLRAPDWPAPVRYGIAVAAPLVAAGVRGALSTRWGDDLPFLTFIPAIVLSAWAGGFGPGIVTTALGAVLASCFWLPPYGSLRVATPARALGLVFFGAIGALTSALSESMFRGRRRLEGLLHSIEFETFYEPFGRWFWARVFPTAEGFSALLEDVTAGYSMHVAKPVDPVELGVIVANLAGRSPSG